MITKRLINPRAHTLTIRFSILLRARKFKAQIRLFHSAENIPSLARVFFVFHHNEIHNDLLFTTNSFYHYDAHDY